MTTHRPSPLAQDFAVDPEFVFIVPYFCPHCHASLEARANGPPSWLRCPTCGRAGLPPEQNRSVAWPELDDETLMIRMSVAEEMKAPLPIKPRGMAPLPARLAAKSSTIRLFLGSGLLLSMILFVVAWLDANNGRIALFGLIAVVCMILLTRKNGQAPEG